MFIFVKILFNNYIKKLQEKEFIECQIFHGISPNFVQEEISRHNSYTFLISYNFFLMYIFACLFIFIKYFYMSVYIY